MIYAGAAALIVFGVVQFAWGATVQLPIECGSYALLNDKLTNEFTEVPVESGVTSSGALIIRYENAETGAWTVVGRTKGLACVLAEGYGWTPLDVKPTEDGPSF